MIPAPNSSIDAGAPASTSAPVRPLGPLPIASALRRAWAKGYHLDDLKGMASAALQPVERRPMAPG